jgi:hypothetical protein
MTEEEGDAVVSPLEVAGVFHGLSDDASVEVEADDATDNGGLRQQGRPGAGTSPQERVGSARRKFLKTKVLRGDRCPAAVHSLSGPVHCPVHRC